MRYEYYDLEKHLLEVRENPEGEARTIGEEITLRLEGLTATHWRVLAVTEPGEGVQKVAIKPI